MQQRRGGKDGVDKGSYIKFINSTDIAKKIRINTKKFFKTPRNF